MGIWKRKRNKAELLAAEQERARKDAEQRERETEQARVTTTQALLSGAVQAFEATLLQQAGVDYGKLDARPGDLTTAAVLVFVSNGRVYMAEHGNSAALVQVCEKAREMVVSRALGATVYDACAAPRHPPVPQETEGDEEDGEAGLMGEGDEEGDACDVCDPPCGDDCDREEGTDCDTCPGPARLEVRPSMHSPLPASLDLVR